MTMATPPERGTGNTWEERCVGISAILIRIIKQVRMPDTKTVAKNIYSVFKSIFDHIYGWGTRIRTWAARSRAESSTTKLFPIIDEAKKDADNV